MPCDPAAVEPAAGGVLSAAGIRPPARRLSRLPGISVVWFYPAALRRRGCPAVRTGAEHAGTAYPAAGPAAPARTDRGGPCLARRPGHHQPDLPAVGCGVRERRLPGAAPGHQPAAAADAADLRGGGAVDQRERVLCPNGAAAGALQLAADQRRRRRRRAAEVALRGPDGVPGPGLAAADHQRRLHHRAPDGDHLRRGVDHQVRHDRSERLLLLGRPADLLQQPAAPGHPDRGREQVDRRHHHGPRVRPPAAGPGRYHHLRARARPAQR